MVVIITFTMMNRTLEKNYQMAHRATLVNTSRLLDYQMLPLVGKIRSLLGNDALISILTNSNMGFDASQKAQLTDILNGLMFQEKDVNSAVIIDRNGHIFFKSNVNRGAYDLYHYYEENPVESENWCSDTRLADGKELFWGKGVLSGMPDEQIWSVTKLLKRPDTGESIGYLVLNMSRAAFRDIFLTGDEGYRTSAYMIVDPRTGMTSPVCLFGEGNKQDGASILSEYVVHKSDKYIYADVVNERTGWVLLHALERRELNATSLYLRRLLAVFFFIMLAICVGLSRTLARSITSPLYKLEKVIRQVGEGKRRLNETFDLSEVGRIGSQFQDMVNTNLELSERLMETELREREAELLLLQSQINPHFLYNTLDSVYCVAMIHGDDQIADMVLALSNHFKLALNRGDRYICVVDAIEQLKEYVKLQNIRFHDRFTLRIEAGRDVLPMKILNFLLQPFVENAIHHGLEPKLGSGCIDVKAYTEQRRLYIIVSDDGVGTDDTTAFDRGYAVKNVKERIRLNYGEPYGVSITSAKGVGTTVRLTLPVETWRYHVPDRSH